MFLIIRLANYPGCFIDINKVSEEISGEKQSGKKIARQPWR
jgi:hypothetical protein